MNNEHARVEDLMEAAQPALWWLQKASRASVWFVFPGLMWNHSGATWRTLWMSTSSLWIWGGHSKEMKKNILSFRGLYTNESVIVNLIFHFCQRVHHKFFKNSSYVLSYLTVTAEGSRWRGESHLASVKWKILSTADRMITAVCLVWCSTTLLRPVSVH